MLSPVEEIKNRLDVLEVIQGYLKLHKAGSNWKGLCPFHSEKTPSFMVSPSRQMWHCFGCFPPGQKVKTPFGYHNIETIDDSHYVYSGNGEIRKVLAVHRRNYKGCLVDVRVRKLGGVVSLTADHKLKVIRPKTKYFKKNKQFYRQCRNLVARGMVQNISPSIERYGDFLEIKAGELKLGDFVLYPINTSLHDLEKIDLKGYLSKSYTFGPRPVKIPYVVRVDDDLIKLIGYWIAEGSNHRAYIRFSLGDHEGEFAEEIARLTKKIFGLTASIHKRFNKNKTGLEVTVCHSYLADIFENLCGLGADNKHIPFVLQVLPAQKQKLLVEAIFRGDGYSFVANRSSRRHRSITTVSRILAEQLVDILLRNNLYPSLRITKAKVDKQKVRHKEAYSVIWSEEAEGQHVFVYTASEAANYWLLPVKSVSQREYIGPVYNLTVQHDHSYIATNFAVSNCGTGGDIFTFVSKIEGVEFADALRLLADKAGVKLSRQDPQIQSRRKRLYEVCELAARFFERQLVSSAGQAASKYLQDRGVSQESIKNFRIGWAPDSWQSLANFLNGEGYSDQETEAAGLIVKGESRPNEYHDRFRHRIMFPVCDSQGQVIGFSGRLFDKIQGKTVHADAGKYINTPNTALYDKSRVLYGLEKAKSAIREKGSCVLVEGNLDVVLSHQAGVENTVAPCGTAFSMDHFKLIKRYCDRLLLAFDADEAGDAALQRSIGTALSQGFRVMVAAVPLGKDAADVVKENPKLWLASVEKPVPYIEYILARSLAKFPSGVDGKKAVLAVVLPFVKSVYSPLERDHWLQEVAQRLGVGKDVVTAELKLVAPPSDQVTAAASPAGSGDLGQVGSVPKLRQEEYLLALLIKYPVLRRRAGELELNLFEYPHLAAAVKNLVGGEEKNEVVSSAAVLAGDFLEEFVTDPEAEFSRLAASLKRQHLQNQLRTIQADIKKAEVTGDRHNLELLLAEFNNLSKNLNEI